MGSQAGRVQGNRTAVSCVYIGVLARKRVVGRVAALFAVALACDAGGEHEAAAPGADPGSARVVDVRSVEQGAAAPPPAEAGAEAGVDEPGLPETRGLVILVPLRRFPRRLLTEVASALRDELDVEVHVHEPIPLPEEAYYRPRRRYRADVILDHLHELRDVDGWAREDVRVLGLTEVDISTTKDPYEDWGIFGLGEAPGHTCVVSIHRLRRGKASPVKLEHRLRSVAIHEVGHTFGLPHCDEAAEGCVMQDAEGSIRNTDTSTGHLGPECRDALERRHPSSNPAQSAISSR